MTHVNQIMIRPTYITDKQNVMNTLFPKITIIIFFFLLTGCGNHQKSILNDDFKYSIDQPIEGQLHTAKRMKVYMAEKKYEEAINLFSKERQANIREIQQDEEIFNFWTSAWALDDKTYDLYCSRIRKGNGVFVFEDGEWKIDEK